jgi:hypothetical protein
MDREDDIERLFSWLQTPELRYWEFADGREIIPDTVIFPRAPGQPPPLADPLPETDGSVAPVEFRLVVNQTTAVSMGLKLPADLLARADDVIE